MCLPTTFGPRLKPVMFAGGRAKLDTSVDRVASLAGATIADLDVPARGAGAITVTMQEGLTPADLNAALVRAGLRVSALVPVGDTLEDVFLHLVEGADVPR